MTQNTFLFTSGKFYFLSLLTSLFLSWCIYFIINLIIQCMQLNRITLGKHKSDSNKWMIQLTGEFCVLLGYRRGSNFYLQKVADSIIREPIKRPALYLQWNILFVCQGLNVILVLINSLWNIPGLSDVVDNDEPSWRRVRSSLR